MEIKVIICEPDKKPEVRNVENSLEALQELVGGWIEIKYMPESMVAICNEEGRIHNLKHNSNYGLDLVGTFIVSGISEAGTEFSSLSDKQIEFMKRFK